MEEELHPEDGIEQSEQEVCTEETPQEPTDAVEEPRTEAAYSSPVRRRRKSVSKLRFKIPEFLTKIGEDVRWYYDIRLWSPVLILLLVLALVIPANARKETTEKAELTENTESIAHTETTEPETVPIDPEAEALARLADSVGSGRSDNVKEIIMWIAVNRSEDRANGYGKTLIEEISRENQWQGYDENTVYSQGTYDIAVRVLDTVANGGLRPLYGDMLWLVLNDDGSVTVRNKFTGGDWREETFQ